MFHEKSRKDVLGNSDMDQKELKDAAGSARIRRDID